MSDSELSRVKEVPVSAPEEILAAVAELSEQSGYQFKVTSVPVEGTDLYVVYAEGYPFPARYTLASGIFGFRVPRNFPNACPEDSFFIQPHDVKLKDLEPTRNSIEIHRASPSPDLLKGTELGGAPALVFSWHIWNRGIWNRSKHTLVDHYTHCLRRFDEPEHDR